MGFKSIRIILYITALMGLSALAANYSAAPRVLVSSGLSALFITELLRRTIQQMQQHTRAPVAEIPLGLPIDHQTLSNNFIQMEARLEHAPIALFLVAPTTPSKTNSVGTLVNAADSGMVTPLNSFARRMLAPGRIIDLYDFSRKLAANENEHRHIIIFDTDRGQERALVAVNYVHLNGGPERLIAVLPIESELETVAFNAWQQLVHVLTHEIMNSLTPVASLSRTAHDLLADLYRRSIHNVQDAESQDISADLFTALDAISRRSDSLVGFVSNYRSLTNVPPPHPERIALSTLFARIAALLTADWHNRGGAIVFTVEPITLEIMIDPGQLEQAIINLIKNAEQATENGPAPSVLIHARLSRGGRLRIEVNDNGPGVPEDLIPHIFTPFFTTKAKGSGIGLAMVRQLVHSNGGTARYVKVANTGARFILMF